MHQRWLSSLHRFILPVLISLLAGLSASSGYGQQIQLAPIPPSCLGGTIPISFTAIGPFEPGNQFKIIVNDDRGSRMTVVQGVTVYNGLLRIPDNVYAGIPGRVEIESTRPLVASNVVPLLANRVPSAQLLPAAAEAIINPGETLPLTVALTGGGPYSLQFTDGQRRDIDNVDRTVLTVFPSENKTYQIATVSNHCGVAGGQGAVSVQVRPVGMLVTRLSTTEPCTGQPLLISYSTDRPLPANTSFKVDFLPNSGGATQTVVATNVSNGLLRVVVPSVSVSGTYRLRVYSETANVSAYYRDYFDLTSTLINIRRTPNIQLTGGTTINFGQTAQVAATVSGAGSGIVTFSDGSSRAFTAYEPGTGQTIAVQPTQTTTYAVQRVNSGCGVFGAEASSGSATVTVRPGYRIDSLSSTSVCTGQAFQVFFTTNEGPVSTNAAEYSLRGAARYVGDQLQAGTVEFQVQRVVAGAQPNTGVLTAIARNVPADYLTNNAYNRDGPLAAGMFYCQLARNGNAGNVYAQPLAVATPPQLLLRSAPQSLTQVQVTYLFADLVSHTTPTDITLSDGSRVQVRGTIEFGQKLSTVPIEAVAKQTTTFSVASVQNGCGVGTAQGSVMVQVRGDTTAIFMRQIPAVLCGNTPVSVAFTTVGTFAPNTTYRVEIMENDGLFKGRYLASGAGSPISVTIPVGYSLFNSIQLRVVASNPASGTATVVSAARAFTYLDPSQMVKLSVAGTGLSETVIRPGDGATLRLAGGGNNNTPVEATLSNGQQTTFPSVGGDVVVRPTQTTTYTIRSVRNLCGAATGTGTVTVRVQPFLWQPQLQQTAYCEGDSLGVTVVGPGEAPANATHSVQLMRNENVLQTLPARLVGNRLTATLPSSLSINTLYAVRILSAAGNEQYYSTVSAERFRVNRVPRLQLTPPNGQTAVVLEANQNSVDVRLLDPNNPTATAVLPRPFRYRINDQFYTQLDNLPTTVPLFANNARPTSYSVSAVYDAYCGFGVATGSVRVSYKPGLRSLVLNQTQFCRNGDQATVAYEVAGDFDANARFTLFLTSANGTRVQVAQSANPIDRITFPIPQTLTAGTYQVSLISSVTGLPGFDNAPTITIGDVPRVVIAGGNTAQYADQPVVFAVRVVSGSLPVSVTFTNGAVQTLNTPETTLTLPAQQGGTYQIARTSNGCGVGTSSGAVSVTVLPNAPNELRVGNVGPGPDLQGICQGGTLTVTLDAKGTFGAGNAYTVYLSDTTGLNYRALPTRALASNVLSATLPAEVIGSGYRIRVGASNPALVGASSSIFSIRPPVTATIAGPTQAFAGELVPIVISFTGSGPWSLTLNNSLYGMEVYTVNESPFLYRVRPDGTTTYTLQGVYNLQCGPGRATGSLTVTILNPLAVDPNVPVTATVAPNPTAGLIRVSGTLPNVRRVRLRLADVQGRTLQAFDLGEISTLAHDVDLSALATGTYLLSVESDAGRTVFKILKQ